MIAETVRRTAKPPPQAVGFNLEIFRAWDYIAPHYNVKQIDLKVVRCQEMGRVLGFAMQLSLWGKSCADTR
jgi:hypothetical protein